MSAVQPPASTPIRQHLRRLRLPVALGAMLASFVGVVVFPLLAHAHRSPLWPLLGVVTVALAGGVGGALHHAVQRLPSRVARGVGLVVYVAVTSAAFAVVVNGTD